MPLTTEQRDQLVSELRRIGAQLNLTDDQKHKLHDFMSEASERVHEFKLQNPNATQQDLIKKVADNRASIRQRLVDFLTPEQLAVWDNEVAKAKEFLGQRLAA